MTEIIDDGLTLRDHLSRIGQKGGESRTEAQRLARQENARKARTAKLKKRYGTLEEEPCPRISSE
jgi:hypothetical protein